MKQLAMRRQTAQVRHYCPPEGFRLEYFRGTDEELDDWREICSAGGIGDGTPAVIEWAIRAEKDLIPEENLLFAVDAKGRRLATVIWICQADGNGRIHMFSSLPECRGRGLGRCLLSHALEKLEAHKCPIVSLTTDDWRKAAIKLYLDFGFLPYLWHDEESDMSARWDEVLSVLGYNSVRRLPENV